MTDTPALGPPRNAKASKCVPWSEHFVLAKRSGRVRAPIVNIPNHSTLTHTGNTPVQVRR